MTVSITSNHNKDLGKGQAGNLAHNRRDFISHNVDKALVNKNIVYDNITIEAAYDSSFDYVSVGSGYVKWPEKQVVYERALADMVFKDKRTAYTKWRNKERLIKDDLQWGESGEGYPSFAPQNVECYILVRGTVM